jgi:4-amino-4-deoxy-L-arabinose transferase-like glycosyltransferase
MQVGRLLRHWPLLPVLAVAAALRLADLFPSFLHGDEAEYALVASYLAADPGDLAYPRIEGFASTPFVSQPPLVLYLFALGIKLTGSTTTGPVLVSVVLGVATVAVTYSIGAKLRDRWLGAISAFFLAVLPYHVGVSRSAQLDAGLAFFVALAALAFLHYLARPSWPRAFAVGVAGGAAALAKLPGLLILVAMTLVVLAMAIAAARAARTDPTARDRLRDVAGDVGVAGIPLTLLAALYLGFLWAMGSTLDLLHKLGWQADRVAGAIPTQATDRPWHWYFTVNEVGILGQLGIVLALLAVVGATTVLRARVREPRDRAGRLFLLLWPLVVFAFFMASDVKQWFYLMPAMPAVAILAAWPLQPAARGLATWLADAKRGWNPMVAATWLVAFVVLAAASPVHATLTERIARQGRFGDGVQDAALWIGEEDPGAGQVGTTLARFTLHLYNGHTTYHYYVNHTFIDERIRADDVRYVVIDTDLNLTFEQDWLYHVVDKHNGTLVHSIPTPGGDPVRVYKLRP